MNNLVYCVFLPRSLVDKEVEAFHNILDEPGCAGRCFAPRLKPHLSNWLLDHGLFEELDYLVLTEGLAFRTEDGRVEIIDEPVVRFREQSWAYRFRAHVSSIC